MQSREQALRQALADLEAQREANVREEARRRREIEEKAPAAFVALREREVTFQNGLEEAFAHPKDAHFISDRTRQKTARLNEKVRKYLKEARYPEDYLSPVYTCPLCRDTGYVGEPVHELCQCVQRRVLELQYQTEGMQMLSRENFDTYDERVYPETVPEGRKKTQRAYMNLVRDHLIAYTDQFAPETGKGMLLTGASGLGKSFLMHCVCQRLLSQGRSVIVLSAYRLSEILRSYQYDGSGQEQVQDLLTCDLLAIDDLGTEPQRPSGTGGLYYILSERMNAARAVFVTTNLDANALYERYGDRIAARLCNASRMEVLPLYGEDVRRYVNG